MKIKIIGLVLTLTAVLGGVLLWQTDELAYNQNLKSLEKQLRQQTVLFESRLMDRVNQFQASLLLELKSGRLQAGDWSLMEPFQQLVILEQFGTRFSQRQIFEKGTDGLSPTAISAFISQANLEFEKTPTAKYLFVPFKDMNRSFTGVVILTGAKSYALIASGAVLGSHSDLFQYPVGEVELFTKNQFVVSANDPAYVGSVRAQDRPSQVALQTAHSRGVVKYETPAGSSLAFFNRIPDTNVILVSKESLEPIASQSRFASILTLSYVLSFCLLLFGALFYLYRRFQQNLDMVEAKVSALIQGQAVAVTDKSVEPELSAIWGLLDSLKMNSQKDSSLSSTTTLMAAKNIDQTDQSKIESFKKVASSLVHEFRGPLASVIGFSQMILGKKPEPEIEKHTNSILREVRHAHEILEKLKVFAGESSGEPVETELVTPLLRAFNNLDQTFKDRGIKVEKKWNSQSKVFLNLPAMQLAFENILKNSIEALDRMPEKEILISLEEDENCFRFTFKDNGEGMDSQQLSRALDPFFTTRTFQNHVGLGLSLAAGVVREHGGELFLESTKGQGTKVVIQLPKVNPIKVISNEQKQEKNHQVENPLPQPIEVQSHNKSESVKNMELDKEKKPTSGSVLDQLPEPDLDLIDEMEVAPVPSNKDKQENASSFVSDLNLSAPLELGASEEKPAGQSLIVDPPKVSSKHNTIKELDQFEVKMRSPKPRSL